MGFISIIDWVIAGFFGDTAKYKPVVPPKVRAQMRAYQINEAELLQAFCSKTTRRGKAPMSTLGIAVVHGREIGVVYRKDQVYSGHVVIIGCFARKRPIRDKFVIGVLGKRG